MPKIKEVYEYNNGSWANGTPIGADASNVDVALSDSTSTKDLQTVLGNVSVSDPSMKTQLTGKVNASGGDIKDTVVSVLDPASETDTSEDIDGTDVVVAAGESQTTMWSKFNMFRKRVSNKFSNFLISSVEDVLEPSDTKTYSQAALNSYFADVIGYKTDADVATVGSVADQLSTLNNNFAASVTLQIATTKYGAVGSWDHYIRFGNIVVIDAVHVIPGALAAGTVLAEGYPGCSNGAAPILMTDNNHAGTTATTYRAYLQTSGTLRLGTALSSPGSSPFSMRCSGAYITND